VKSFKTTLLSLAVILLSLTAFANADRQLIDLGPGVAYSINDKGQIVGCDYYYTGEPDTIPPINATLFDSTGGGANIKLGTLNGDNWARAYSINNSGQVVGTSSIGHTTSHACLFDTTGAGNNKYLGDFGGGISSAKSINDNGLIVGESYSVSVGQYGCLYTTKYDPLTHKTVPVVVNLGTISGGFGAPLTRSSALSINNKGHIVGYVANASWNDPDFYYACLFDETGNKANKKLGALGGSQGTAYSINDSDQIVGWATTNSNSMHACLFDNTGGGANIDIGTLSNGFDYSYAVSINDLGQIVGYASNGFYELAVLFDATGRGNNIDLNTLIDSSSWTLRQAYGINNNGWIVGDMTNASGDTHAFLLTPEPATLLLFALGGLILRKSRLAGRKRNPIRDALRRA